MNETIEYYNKNAKNYCDSTRGTDMSVCHNKFLYYLPEGASILDAGCGSGRDSKAFTEAGYKVTAIDVSAEVCEEASKLLGQYVQCLSFEEMKFEKCFDGIWACASLLHIPEKQMNEVFKRLRIALKDNGILYASFKYGNQERVSDGRFFNDYDEDKLKTLMNIQNLQILEMFITKDVRQDHDNEKWINVIAKK